jgi:dTDP-4-dehydrorhamnose reductase
VTTPRILIPRVLILGASGQLGQHMQAALSDLPMTALTRRECDIGNACELADWLAWAEPSIVINCAGYTRVDDAEADRDKAERVNAQGPAALARVCAERQAALIHISTDYVFGGQPPADLRRGYTPSDKAAPLNRYGATKLAGEAAIRRALPEHWIVRTSWLFSGRGSNFVRTILRLAAERPELRIVDDQIGTPTWAPHLSAACRALVAAAAAGSAPAFGTYHVAGAPAVSWHGFAAAIVDAAFAAGQLARRPAVVPITTAEFPRPARRPPDSRLDGAALLTALGLPPADWRDGLAAMFKTAAAA